MTRTRLPGLTMIGALAACAAAAAAGPGRGQGVGKAVSDGPPATASRHAPEMRGREGADRPVAAPAADTASPKAGDLMATFERDAGGIRLVRLSDRTAGMEPLAGPGGAPLFAVTLRQAATGKTVTLKADAGWRAAAISSAAQGLTLHWLKPDIEELAGLRITAEAVADAKLNRLSWTLRAEGVAAEWGVWRVAFPQVSLRRFAEGPHLLIQRGSGQVELDAWRKGFSYRGHYPDGWTAMQFMAAYDPGGRTGLYVGMHDPNACVKDLAAAADDGGQVTLAFEHSPSDMGVGGRGFGLSGRAVWQLLRGDWFDAAMIYRDWVRREASWRPAMGPDGRSDTPAWMRDMCAWAMLSGPGEQAVPAARRFAEAIGLPAAFHWYNWHEIPFDNDYPHYFPPKKGFAESVAAIQGDKHPMYVMPYINGRLWDTRDKGSEDFEFSRLALAAATKDQKGQPYIETYGSKEADGSPVKLAVMCPSTRLWQDRVKATVLRLMTECGVKAVYIDQIAAAAPRLCFDKSHGHSLGGGSWWVESYGRMLADLRKAMPPGCMITTECNAEPYVKWFDGYLTWHWQYDGQVPAFPAVYGGWVQMFGRAYRGGPSKDLALRMKAGQQLVFGEQIGWCDAGTVGDRAAAAFLRDTARLRHQLRRYFAAGQMARPPQLLAKGGTDGTGGTDRTRGTSGAGGIGGATGAGGLPRVTADWQWSGVWPVATDAVLAGAWELPGDGSLALIFVNVSDRPVTAELALDAAAYGLGSEGVRLLRVGPDGPGQEESAPSKLRRTLTFQPGEPWAWRLRSPAGRGPTSESRDARR